MNKIKEAFDKVRNDVSFLYDEISSLKQNLKKTHEEIFKILQIIAEINAKITKKTTKETTPIPHTYTTTQHNTLPSPTTQHNTLPSPTTQHNTLPSPTTQHNIPTHPTIISTENTPLKAPKDQNKVFSSGNEGVPTDKQTNRQTDTQHIKQHKIGEYGKNEHDNVIDSAAMILDSLDNIKKEIRLKFKRLTDQEILVFSTLYQLEEKQGYTEYKTLSQKLGLSESSIRDYVGKLIKKGIPVEKKKINNKTIHLSISTNLKKIVTLQTILQLRDI